MAERGGPPARKAAAPDQTTAPAETALEQFAYIVAHDLKEPLRGISINANFLKDEDLSPDGHDKLGRIGDLCQRMDRLITQLAAYAQLGAANVKAVPLDPARILADVSQTLAPFLQQHGAVLNVAPPFSPIKGDLRMVQTAFRNLICNAVLFNDEPRPIVEIGVAPAGSPVDGTSQAVFYVRDNGIGIEPAHRERIFRIFTRLHRTGVYGDGVGAGLALVSRIAEAHGGHVAVTSTPGEGSTFYLSLPLDASDRPLVETT